MLLANIALKSTEDRAVLSCEVTYESSRKDSMTLYIAVDSIHGHMLVESYEAFLLGCFSAALYHDEERIHIEGNLCPYLKNNVSSALLLLKRWWTPGRARVPALSSNSSEPYDGEIAGRKSACFYSGGIDSLANILQNHDTFSKSHLFRYKFGLLVYGLDIGDPNRVNAEDLFQNAILSQKVFADSVGLELIPIWTNIRDIEPDGHFYEEMHFACLLAGLAHALCKSIFRCSISADNTPEYMEKWGSHIALNSLLDSSCLTMTTECSNLDRTDKVGLVAGNSVALSSLRVCYFTNNLEVNFLNCGRCEKCMRTKLALLAHGKLASCSVFPNHRIDVNRIYSVDATRFPGNEFYNDNLADRLDGQGYREYADAIRVINGSGGIRHLITRYSSIELVKSRILQFAKRIYRRAKKPK
jgi:hypothetical protein